MLNIIHSEYRILISDFQNTIVLKPTGYFGIKLTAGIIFILLFVAPSTSIIQDASASKPTAQIISAKADGSNIIKDTLITLGHGKTNSFLSFEFRGFDETDHIVELQCSFDGINYMKTNCASQSEESQSSFSGSDGVQRNYNVKSGKAYRQVTPLLYPKTYFFGVKVLNDNNELSPAVTWTFKMRTATDAPLEGGSDVTPGFENEKKIKRITVHFDSIFINRDRDGDPRSQFSGKNPGEWYLLAVVQGKVINLVQGKVYDKQNYQLEGKEITVDIRDDMPLYIFTYGIESDSLLFPVCKPNLAKLSNDVAQVFMLPSGNWAWHINNFNYDNRLHDPKNPSEVGLFQYFEPTCKKGDVLGMTIKTFYGDIAGGVYELLDIHQSDFILKLTVTSRVISP